MHRFGLPASLGLSLVLLGAVAAADWPQWRGPDRTGRSAETGLVKALPQGGPRLAWTFEQAGLGYSGPAVVGTRLYSLGSEEDEDKEFVFCLDTASGKEVWRTPLVKLSNATRVSPGFGGGPRSTPTVDGDSLYALGCKGDLVCLETATGTLRWQKNMVKDFGGRAMANWGYCESPLVDGDKLICCPGYENGTVAALNKQTGDVLWRSKELTDDASYASVVPATAGGVKHYVLKTKDCIAGVATDGKLLWKQKLAVNPTGVIPTPLVRDDLVFTTCGYRGDRGGDCGLVRLSAADGGVKSEIVYRNVNLTNHHGGVVLVGDHVYGHSDAGNDRRGPPSGWTCLELKSGQITWASTKLGKGAIGYADGKLYCCDERSGMVVQIDASPAGWNETGRFTVPKKSANRRARGGFWTHPVVANGQLYLRDQELLFCYDLRSAK